MAPAPPSTALFPYTTLFRSWRSRYPRRAGKHKTRVWQMIWGCAALRTGVAWDRSGCVGELGDRKSTRLNSSHSQISYAVFCLKKKRTAVLLDDLVSYYALAR